MLCKDCKYLRGKSVGIASTVYWCGKVGDFYKKTSIGVYPWKNKPHPKCPIKNQEQKKENKKGE